MISLGGAVASHAGTYVHGRRRHRRGRAIYASNRTGAGAGGSNLWYATRSSASGTFGAPKPVPDVNGGTNDGDPWLSLDGCRLYWASDRSGDFDVYTGTIQ